MPVWGAAMLGAYVGLMLVYSLREEIGLGRAYVGLMSGLYSMLGLQYIGPFGSSEGQFLGPFFRAKNNIIFSTEKLGLEGLCWAHVGRSFIGPRWGYLGP